MMMKKIVLGIIVLFFWFSGKAQEEYIVGQSRFLQKINASFFGFNNLTKVGVMYNSFRVNNDQNIDNKYFFGALSFDEKKFSVGLDVNSFKTQNTGFTSNLANFTYVYRIQLKQDLFLLPAITLGFANSRYSTSSFIFEDQLNKATGFINTQSIDPLNDQVYNITYLDIGASFLLHSDTYLFGLSLKHLNQPNASFNKEVRAKKPIQISVNGGYEFNINPFERGLLPSESFLYTFASVTQYKSNYYLYFSQDIQLGEFSFGVNQQGSMIKAFNLNNIGASMSVSMENFDFGMAYNFPMRNPSRVFAPSIFEVFITFEFSKYRRNGRGLFKRLQIDNYF